MSSILDKLLSSKFKIVLIKWPLEMSTHVRFSHDYKQEEAKH